MLRASDFRADDWKNTMSNAPVVKDSNGQSLSNGCSVQVIKDLKVKGADVLKRGTIFKNIRLTDDDRTIEAGTGRNTVVLKTEFLKKV
jgi:protein PhnA